MAIEAGTKTVRWIDLFFDLVFVATAHEVTTVLKNSVSLFEAGPYLVLFVAVLWLWISHTLYSARFQSRGFLYGANTFLSMIAVFALVIQLHGAFDEYLLTFALTYAFAKGILVLFYIEALIKNPLKIIYILPLLVSYIASMILWAASPFVEYPLLFWVLAFLIDVLSPLYARGLLQRIQIHASHLPERLGLLTVIMLGEMIISLVGSAHGLELTKHIIIVLFLGMVTTAFIFWSYFRYVEHSIVDSDNSSSHLYLYSHVPLYLSLIFLASAFKGALLLNGTRWQFTMGVILFIISFRAIKYVQERYIPIRQLIIFIVYGVLTIGVMTIIPDNLLGLSLLSSLFLIYLILSDLFLGIFRERRSAPKKGLAQGGMQW